MQKYFIYGLVVLLLPLAVVSFACEQKYLLSYEKGEEKYSRIIDIDTEKFLEKSDKPISKSCDLLEDYVSHFSTFPLKGYSFVIYKNHLVLYLVEYVNAIKKNPERQIANGDYLAENGAATAWVHTIWTDLENPDQQKNAVLTKFTHYTYYYWQQQNLYRFNYGRFFKYFSGKDAYYSNLLATFDENKLEPPLDSTAYGAADDIVTSQQYKDRFECKDSKEDKDDWICKDGKPIFTNFILTNLPENFSTQDLLEGDNTGN